MNLSVLAWFAVRRRQFRTVKQVATNIVLPVIGMALTGLLWSFLHADALISGLVWVSVGVIYAVVLTKVTGKRLADLGMDESAATEVEEAFATEPRTGPRVLAGV